MPIVSSGIMYRLVKSFSFDTRTITKQVYLCMERGCVCDPFPLEGMLEIIALSFVTTQVGNLVMRSFRSIQTAFLCRVYILLQHMFAAFRRSPRLRRPDYKGRAQKVRKKVHTTLIQSITRR